MSKIPSRMIEVDTSDPTRKINLNELLLSSESIPLEMWGVPNQSNVEKAIAYLREIGGGCVRVPAVYAGSNLLFIRVSRDKFHNMVTSYEYYNYRPPSVGETRPYTDDAWRIGDVIRNSDLKNSSDKTLYWYCYDDNVSSDGVVGVEGAWKYIKADTEAGSNKISYQADTETLIFT
jgi:hypothetical protein